MKRLNKKVLGIALTVFFLAMLAIPVCASPTKGNKVAVTITWTSAGVTYVDDATGNVVHRHAEGNWDPLVLEIDGGPTYTGSAVNTVREGLRVPQKDGLNIIMREYLEMWFPSAGGGFKGHILVWMDGITGPPLTVKRARAHGLLQGYGAFEGQTLNAGHKWREPGPEIVWTGYLLKPLP